MYCTPAYPRLCNSSLVSSRSECHAMFTVEPSWALANGAGARNQLVSVSVEKGVKKGPRALAWEARRSMV